ncbi:hypothetical protein OH76DRAFT_1489010 [Lentinus brumalis]|uniref:Uncharacterized protein n=1 Tax=Lentinus brumalis TaxID=2498619 RepID=A0A371CP45_9APHY|nr:hypothetical protein OH76DRAFT_1489010 [Polyporus brumalis]
MDPRTHTSGSQSCITSADNVSHSTEWYRTTVFEYPQFYNRIHPATSSVKDPSGATVGFCYLRRIEPHDKVFLAFADGVDDRDRIYVVKFTPRYSAEAHRLLAAANCAPDLVYCGSPYPEFPGYTRMQMVVTEHVPSGLTMWEVSKGWCIDFDWAGLEGVARYPHDLAEDVPWPVGADPGALITQDHDNYWLERLFKPRERV